MFNQYLEFKDLILDKLRNRSDLTVKEFTEIYEYELNNFISKNKLNKLDIIDLNVDEAYAKSKILSNTLLSYLKYRFNIKFDFTDYEDVKNYISKSLIELVINKNTNLDIVPILVDTIVTYISEINIDIDKIDKMYLYKEFNDYLLNYYSELEEIHKVLVSRNTILSNIKNKKYLLLPIKWINITIPVTYVKQNIKKEYLTTYLIGGDNENK